MKKKIKFYYKKIFYEGNYKGDVRYFECPFCKRFQLDDKGNYLCWTCEDGKLLKIPLWRKGGIRWNKMESIRECYKFQYE